MCYSIEMQKQKNPKLRNVFTWELDLDKYGSVVDMNEITAGGQNILTFVTTRGRLCGLDLRSQELAWDLENNPKRGINIVSNYTNIIIFKFRFNVVYGCGPIPELGSTWNQSRFPCDMGHEIPAAHSILATRGTWKS